MSLRLAGAAQAYFFLSDVQILASSVARKGEAQGESVNASKAMGGMATGIAYIGCTT
jgi:hypothetical protein